MYIDYKKYYTMMIYFLIIIEFKFKNNKICIILFDKPKVWLCDALKYNFYDKYYLISIINKPKGKVHMIIYININKK